MTSINKFKCQHCTTNIIKQAIIPAKNGYTIFIRPWCPYSQNAIKLLQNNGLFARCYNLDHEKCKSIEIALSKNLQKKGKRFTVPQIYLGNKYIGGYNELVKYLKK